MTNSTQHTEGGKYHKTKQQLEQEFVLITAAQNNSVCFQPLYEEYYKPIFKFIYRRIGDEQLTADLTSHVFLKALVNIKKFVPRAVPFSSWLYRIALNEMNMYFRKNTNSRTISFDMAKMTNIASEVDIKPDTELEKAMMDAVASLEDESVQLIEMRFFEERPFAEIAEICGISEANAKMKVYRILERLKKMLQRRL